MLVTWNHSLLSSIILYVHIYTIFSSIICYCFPQICKFIFFQINKNIFDVVYINVTIFYVVPSSKDVCDFNKFESVNESDDDVPFIPSLTFLANSASFSASGSCIQKNNF